MPQERSQQLCRELLPNTITMSKLVAIAGVSSILDGIAWHARRVAIFVTSKDTFLTSAEPNA